MDFTLDSNVLAERSFAVRALPVRASSRLLRRRRQRQLAGTTRVQLGCGPNVLEGWANLDIGKTPGVTPFDLTAPLPFATGSIDRVYSEHFIEHVSLRQGEKILSECARILRPGGVLRVSTPDLRTLVDEYVAGRTDEWLDQDWTPLSPCQMLNEGLRLWGHRFVWDEDELTAALTRAGFTMVTRAPWQESSYEDLAGLECRSFHRDLIVEAVR